MLFHLAYHVPTRSGVKMHPGTNRQVEGQQGSAIHSQPNRSIRTWHRQGLIGVMRGLLCNMVFACYSACRGLVRGGSLLEMQSHAHGVVWLCRKQKRPPSRSVHCSLPKSSKISGSMLFHVTMYRRAVGMLKLPLPGIHEVVAALSKVAVILGHFGCMAVSMRADNLALCSCFEDIAMPVSMFGSALGPCTQQARTPRTSKVPDLKRPVFANLSNLRSTLQLEAFCN